MSSNTKSKTVTALRALLAALCSSAMLVMSGHAANAQTAGHPLDALTAQEYWAIFDTLQASGRVNSDTDYPSIS
ncbi:MAG: hypothetical protein M3007_04850, partial [Candidatus Eremiobacteraeota bacterium]|nr:hypothetical protein [Candidatus Eremiobacteraeota bacterium]